MKNYSISQSAVQERKAFNNIYNWMAIALTITGVSSLLTLSSPLGQAIMSNSIFMIGTMLGVLGLVFFLSARITKLSVNAATGLFIAYSALNGVMLAPIFLVYTGESIASTFFVTAATFIAMSVYGNTTKADLSELGKMMIMGLFGIIIASVVNLFLKSSALYWAITYIGVAVFIGLIAYDTQKLKQMMSQFEGDDNMVKKFAIYGALTLYLDFINLFILLLRILGNRK